MSKKLHVFSLAACDVRNTRLLGMTPPPWITCAPHIFRFRKEVRDWVSQVTGSLIGHFSQPALLPLLFQNKSLALSFFPHSY